MRKFVLALCVIVALVFISIELGAKMIWGWSDPVPVITDLDRAHLARVQDDFMRAPLAEGDYIVWRDGSIDEVVSSKGFRIEVKATKIWPWSKRASAIAFSKEAESIERFVRRGDPDHEDIRTRRRSFY